MKRPRRHAAMKQELHTERSIDSGALIEQKPMAWQSRLLRKYYVGRPGWENGTAYFHRYLLDQAPARGSVLELGPGPTNHTTRWLREHFERVDGLDVDPEVLRNRDLSKAFVYDGSRWPIDSDAYDAVVADFVFEHIADPRLALSEAHRCLRPGGVLILRTPNLWHYVTIGSRLTPHWVHAALVPALKRQPGDVHAPYPTHYRINTAAAVKRHARKAGFTVVDVTRIEREPAYGMASRLLFYPFMWYERMVNSSEWLAFARSVLIGTLRRPATPAV
ncbi:MAG: class I SAM-dependent methyltransferase [Phycisphaerae bacterium]|nr:class I SAM-dependent methyltransferase [Phycisphaerae bacterium]